MTQGGLFDEAGVTGRPGILPMSANEQIARSLAEAIAGPAAVPEDAMHLLILDARSLLDACYHASKHEDRRSPAGLPVGGVSSFTRSVFELLRRTGPTHAVATFDHPEGSADRKAILPGYKDRPDKPLDQLAQIDMSERVLRALGMHVISTPTGEADDVVATLLRRAPHDAQVTIYSTDKDLLQLGTRPHTRIVWRRGGEWSEAVGDAGALTRLGVRCAQVADFLSLAGDTCDGVPGCPGIGKKWAQSLLGKFHSIDGIFANLDRLGVPGAEGLAERLRRGRPQILQARAVVRLRHDLDCPQLPADTAALSVGLSWSWDAIDSGALEALGRELGLLWLQREAQAARQPCHEPDPDAF